MVTEQNLTNEELNNGFVTTSGDSSQEDISFYDKLPSLVLNRVFALKSLQEAQFTLEKKLHLELNQLEQTYENLYEEIGEKRNKIVNGIEEPDANQIEIGKKLYKEQEGGELEKELFISSNVKGIPDFWTNCLLNNTEVSELIFEPDHGCLHYLTDIKFVNGLDSEKSTDTIQFHFKQNPYFTNPILTKSYIFVPGVPTGSLEAVEAIGCTIDWKEKMNLTEKSVKRKFRMKMLRSYRTEKVLKPLDSFFNFFKPEDVDPDAEEDNANVHDTNFNVFNELKNKVIPHAVDYYTQFAWTYEQNYYTESEDESEENYGETDEGENFNSEEDQLSQSLNGLNINETECLPERPSNENDELPSYEP